MGAEKYWLRQDGQSPLVFEGEVVLERSNQWVGGSKQTRWHEVEVYRTTGDRWVLNVVAYRQGKPASHKVRVADDPEGLRYAIEGLVPEDLRGEIFEELGYESPRGGGHKMAGLFVEEPITTIPEEEWQDYVQAVVNEESRTFRIGQKVKFQKNKDAIVVGFSQWDDDRMRWRMPNGDYCVFGPYIIHVLEKNLIIGAAEHELE